MKNLIICAAILLSTAAVADLEISGVITPTIKSGSTSASEAHITNFEVADAQLEFVGQVNSNLTGTLIFFADQEYMDDPTSYSLIDEAYLTQNIFDLSIKFGRSYLPFGSQETSFISDPVTLTFGEVQTDLLELSTEKWGLSGAIYTYAASAWEDGEKEGLNSYGATLAYEHKHFALGASYLSNMSKSGILDLTGVVNKMPGAYALFGKGNYKGVSLLAEYMSALSSFDSGEYTYTKNGVDREVTPSVFNVEVAYTRTLFGKEVSIAMGHQFNYEVATSDKVLAPAVVFLTGISVNIYEGANLALEYRQATDHKATEGGATDEHTAQMTTLAYSIEF